MKRQLLWGIVLVAMGSAIFWSSHTLWGLRGLAYALIGGYMIADERRRCAHEGASFAPTERWAASRLAGERV